MLQFAQSLTALHIPLSLINLQCPFCRGPVEKVVSTGEGADTVPASTPAPWAKAQVESCSNDPPLSAASSKPSAKGGPALTRQSSTPEVVPKSSNDPPLQRQQSAPSQGAANPQYTQFGSSFQGGGSSGQGSSSSAGGAQAAQASNGNGSGGFGGGFTLWGGNNESQNGEICRALVVRTFPHLTTLPCSPPQLRLST